MTGIAGFLLLRQVAVVFVGAVFVALCVGIWAARKWQSWRQQIRLKKILCQISLYKPLLDEYPEALMFFPDIDGSE